MTTQLEAKLDAILNEVRHTRANTVLALRLLGRSLSMEQHLDKTVEQILAEQAQAFKNIESETQVDVAIAAAFDAERKTNEDLRNQLAAALAANNPEQLRQVLTNMDALLAAQSTELKVKAVLDNTQAPGTSENPNPA